MVQEEEVEEEEEAQEEAEVEEEEEAADLRDHGGTTMVTLIKWTQSCQTTV